jgi:protein-tyrosine phosphatase
MRNVIFVCWGNICRSPMAERVAEKMAAAAHLDDVTFTSAGTSAEEQGNPIDPPARRTLERHGYRAAGHRAHRITADEIDQAELVVAMEPLHVNLLLRRAPDAQNIVLMSDYDPDHRGEPIDDPWGHSDQVFAATLKRIEAALPGLLATL